MFIPRRRGISTRTTSRNNHSFHRKKTKHRIPLALEFLEPRELLSADNETFVARLYQQILQRPADTGVIGFVEDAVSGADQPLRAARGIPGHSEPRTEIILVDESQAVWHSGIPDVIEANGSRRNDLGLLVGNKHAAQPVLRRPGTIDPVA